MLPSVKYTYDTPVEVSQAFGREIIDSLTTLESIGKYLDPTKLALLQRIVLPYLSSYSLILEEMSTSIVITSVKKKNYGNIYIDNNLKNMRNDVKINR